MKSISIFLTAVFVLSISSVPVSAEEPTVQLSLRVEFYDLPSIEALRIQEEVAIQPDQTEARERILEMVEKGEASFVTSTPLMARPGSRAKYEDVESVPIVSGFTWNEEAEQLVPEFGERDYGTVFEVDSAFAEGGETLDINFALEHHTGPPTTETLRVPMGDAGESKEVTVTRFHMKKVTTRLFIDPGAVALVGAFEITGDTPGSADEGARKRLAFFCAEVQKLERK